ncbi:MAG: hypothetical protein ACUVRV_07905 [Cyanobacteriota bacterium]
MVLAYYGKIWRNTCLLWQGIRWARYYKPQAEVVLGGWSCECLLRTVGPFSTQCQDHLIQAQKNLLGKVIQGHSLASEPCYRAKLEQLCAGMVHKRPQPLQKTACDYSYIEEI